MTRLKWILRSPLRILSFFSKELFETLREPRLIASLILGPFIILLLFGTGYSDIPRPFRTQLVHPDSEEYQKVEGYINRLQTPQLQILGSTPNLDEALGQLRARQLDVVFAMPPEPFETIMAGKQVSVTLYHNEIDPVQANYLKYFGDVYISVLNRVTLEDTLKDFKDEAQDYRT
jgi:ABC-2 type transport system permease protein